MIKFVKRIKTMENTIFYSIFKKENVVVSFARLWDGYKPNRQIINVHFDKDFNILCYGRSIVGEDPRIFEHNNEIYVVDNYLDDVHLFCLNNNNRIKINLKGKNFSFISHNNDLYFIYTMKPFVLYRLDLSNHELFNVDVDNNNSDNTDLRYRGSTPGYKNNDNSYYGLGHKTYFNDNILFHDIFKWVVDFNGIKPSILITDILKDTKMCNICDPTSIINVDSKKYLITAETNKPWFEKQDYITNLYEFIDNSIE